MQLQDHDVMRCDRKPAPVGQLHGLERVAPRAAPAFGLTGEGGTASLRPSASFTASSESPHAMLWPSGVPGRLASTHEPRLEKPPRSYVEMIMKAKSPAHGLAGGRGEAPLGAGRRGA